MRDATRCGRLLAVVLLLVLIPQIALARNKDADAPITGVSAGLIAICAPFGGGFEVGYWGFALILGDPPDPVNACNAVALSVTPFPDVGTLASCPGIDPGLEAVMDAAMDDMDQVVANGQAFQKAFDRYSGAVAIGEDACANDRLQEMITFNDDLRAAVQQSTTSLDAYITAQDADDSTVLDATVTKADVKSLINQVASGSFPLVDSQAIASWGLTSSDLLAMQNYAAQIPESDVDEKFAEWDPGLENTVSMRRLLQEIRDHVGDVPLGDAIIAGANPVPAVPYRGLVLMTLALLVCGALVLARRRRLT